MKITYLLALVLLWSCQPEPEPPISPANPDILRGSRELGAEEEAVALRVCEAVKNKDQEYRLLNSAQFEFVVSTQDCSGEIARYPGTRMNLERELGRQEIYFKPVNYQGEFIKEIQTSTVGPLKYFCSDILAGKRVENQVDTLKGVEKLQIRFFRNGTKIGFQVGYYTRALDGRYFIQAEDTVYVNEQVDNQYPLSGLVSLHVQAKYCARTKRLDAKVQHSFSRLFVTR